MWNETEAAPERETVDESGRVRTPMSPATWTADEQRPETQPGVVQPEPAPEPTPEPTPKPAPKPTPKAA